MRRGPNEAIISKVEYLLQGSGMRIALKKIEVDALKLPARSRARLAERLIMSLEETAEPQAEREWLVEENAARSS